jgi:hypothetical protein
VRQNLIIASQRQCQSGCQAPARKRLILRKFMAISLPPQVQDLRQSSPFFVEGPQKRLNLNVYRRIRGPSRSTAGSSVPEFAPPIIGLTGRGGLPIMRRSTEIVRKGDWYVVYVSTAVEPQEEARTRVPQTHEYKKRPESLGPPASQGPRAFDSLDPRAVRTSAPLVFLKQGRFPRALRSGPAESSAKSAWAE